MRTIVFLLVFHIFLQTVICDDSIRTQWRDWKAKYGKTYSDDEDSRRFKTWRENLKIVINHNDRHRKGESSYAMGMNSLAATTKAEFRAMLMPHQGPISPSSAFISYFTVNSTSSPQSVEWTSQDYVTPVKDQGQIGSCYSFSAVEAVEGQFSKLTGKLASFSEQQIVDCNQGGDGGIPFMVYSYLIGTSGLQTEADYPYQAQVETCRYDASKAVATLSSYRFVLPFANEVALQNAVANVGPISVSVIKIFLSFQLYSSGVYYEPKCEDPNLDGEGYHAMLATGYGTDSNGQDYWMVKNSWGTGWGENGYIRMARNRDNNCGIASQATYPIMTSNQTKSSYLGADNGGDGDSGDAVLPSVILMIVSGVLSLFAGRVL